MFLLWAFIEGDSFRDYKAKGKLLFRLEKNLSWSVITGSNIIIGCPKQDFLEHFLVMLKQFWSQEVYQKAHDSTLSDA